MSRLSGVTLGSSLGLSNALYDFSDSSGLNHPIGIQGALFKALHSRRSIRGALFEAFYLKRSIRSAPFKALQHAVPHKTQRKFRFYFSIFQSVYQDDLRPALGKQDHGQ